LSPKKRRRPAPEVLPPDLITAGLAGAGALISGYLAVSGLFAATPLFCAEGSGCDVVQGSLYGRLFGLSISWFGLAGYAAIAASAILAPAEYRRVLVLVLAAGAVGVSAYLTYVEAFVLQEWCSYCIASALIALAIGGRAVQTLGGQPARQLTLVMAAAALLAGAGLPAYIHAQPEPAAVDLDTFEGRLALHLRTSGARFYGTYWCPACTTQKQLFGRAASALPYIECDPRGAGARPAACQAAGIRAYPTWIFPNGARVQGVMALDRLAAVSGFR